MVRKIVGWFAVLAGLLLAVNMGHKAYRRLSSGDLAGPEYVQVGLISALALGGLVLVVFGLRRLRVRRALPPKRPGEGPTDCSES